MNEKGRAGKADPENPGRNVVFTGSRAGSHPLFWGCCCRHVLQHLGLLEAVGLPVNYSMPP